MIYDMTVQYRFAKSKPWGKFSHLRLYRTKVTQNNNDDNDFKQKTSFEIEFLFYNG